MSRSLLLLFIFISPLHVKGQEIWEQLQPVNNPPETLLSGRSAVLYDVQLTKAQLAEMQQSFQQIGIDAVAYFDIDHVFAGTDPTRAFAEYLTNRQVATITLAQRTSSGFRLAFCTYTQKPMLLEPGQAAWIIEDNTLPSLLRTVFQDAWRAQKKQNFLINEFPETDIVVSPFRGNRQEFYAIDLKVDNLAVPRFGDEKMDKDLEELFAANYPLKYKLVDPKLSEQELRRQGFNYILRYVHTRASAAREVLQYDMSRGENAYASISFKDGQLQLKTIPSEAIVYKFYFKHIDNGNVFLGTKWDADVAWQDALRNHIAGFKTEARIN